MTIQCPTCLTDNPDGTIVCICCGEQLASGYVSNHLASGSLLKQG